MPKDKMYKFGVGIDEKSLNRAKDRLADVVKPFEEAMKNVEFDGLTGSNKSKVKTELTSLFKLTEKQAKALQDMVNGVIPSDEKQLNNLRQNVKDLTVFMADAMKRMSDLGEATDWMKNGISFIDAFSHMQNVLKETEQSVGDLPSTIAALTQEFKIFKEALLDINPNAFGKRFGAEMRATTDDIKKAQALIKNLEKQEHKGLQRALKIKKNEDVFDYSDYDSDGLKEAHEDIQESIRAHLEAIAKIEAEYTDKKKSPYSVDVYREAVHELVIELQNFENLKNSKLFEETFSKAGSSTASNVNNITAEITTATKDAVKKIQNALKDIDGIEVAITLPDASSAKFASQISKFVEAATKEFESKPVELSFEITSPFKKDAFDEKLSKDGELQYKKLSPAQQKISDRIVSEFKNESEKSEFTVTEENLISLNHTNTNKIARNILDAFTKLNKAMREGQALLTGTTEKWRKQIEKDLTIKPKFEIDEAKENLNIEMAKLQDEFEVDEENWLTIHADVDGLIDEIQSELTQKTFDVKVKANDIEGGNIVVNADNIRFGPAPNGGGWQNPPTSPRQSQPTPSVSSIPPKQTEPIKTEAPKQTKAIHENSSVVKEGTKAQAVLTNALNELKEAMKVNESRKEMSEQSLKDVQATVQENAEEIASHTKSAEKAEEEWRRHGNTRRLHEEDKKVKETARNLKSKELSDLQKELFDIFKSGDVKAFEEKFEQVVEMLPKAREELQKAIENVKLSKRSDDDKERLISSYTSDIDLIDHVLAKSISPTDKTKSGTRVFFAALSAAYTYRINELNEQIIDLEKEIEDETRHISNYSQSSGSLRLDVKKLKHVDEIENRENGIRKRDSEQSMLASRINKINKILDGNKDPINLVLDEVNAFWKAYSKNAEDAKAYVEKKNAELEALDESIKGKNLDKNSKEYKEYQQKRAAIIEEEKYKEYKKKYNKWEPRRAAMVAAGLDVRGIDKENVLDYLRDLLKSSPALAARLTNNEADLKIRSIQDLAYFIPKVQETMGVKARTENEYMSEEELRTNFKEAIKVASYIEKAQAVLNKFDGDLKPETIQDFIDYFEHIPGMTDAVEAARIYLDNVKNLPEDMFDETDPKTFLDQFKDSWDSMDDVAKSEFLSVLNQTEQFKDKNNVSSIDNVDNLDGMFDNILAAFNSGQFDSLHQETNNSQLQQILNILQRSTLLTQTRDAANKYGEHGIVSALFGIQNSKLAGNNTVPRNPIHMTALSKKGKTKVYTIGKRNSKKGTDNTFSWGPEQLRNAFKFANVTQEIQEITDALFNSALIGQEQLQNEIRGLQSELSTLEGLGQIKTTDKAERKKQLDRFSYNAFDGTDLSTLWHHKKNADAEIESINDVLAANLEMQTFPDKLFNDIKGLREQKRLEREIRELKNKDYSSVKGSFKGLTEKEISERVRNLITAKEQELDVVKIENKTTLENLLADKINKLEELEGKIIKKTQEVITAKQQELTTKQEELTQIKPIAAKAQQIVDDLLNKLFASGKLKLSQGETADEATWAGKYKYQDSELAKYEKRKETNARESERLKAQIAKLESGNYDDDTKALLAENAAKAEVRAQEQQTNLKNQIASLEARIAAIDKGVQDGKTTEDDGKKQKELVATDLEKAKNDLAALEQKMQNGELKVEIEQAQRAYVQQLVDNLKATLAVLEQDSITTNDVIQSLLALEDDMQLSKDKAAYERSQGKGRNKQSRNLLGLIKRGNAYASAKRKYKGAVYSEAWSEHKNEEIAKYGRTSSKDSVAKVDNLLKRIQFAKTHGLMDTTELEQMAIEYEALDKKYHDTEDLKSLGKATTDDVEAAFKELKEYRKKLIDKFFDTEGWFKATRLETQFSQSEGEFRELAKQKREESNPAKDRVSAQKKAIEAQGQKDQGVVEQYTDLLYEEYVEKPKKEIREALKQEVKDIRSAICDNKAAKDAVRQRAETAPETIPELQKEYLKLVNEQESDQELLTLIEKRKKLFDENKVIGSDGKNTQEFKDVENAIAALRKKYSDKFNEIKDQWIREENAKIDAAAIPDSAYSKNAINIKSAEDDRDEAIARLKDKVKTVNIEEELEAFGKYKVLLKEYTDLKSKGQEKTDVGKNLYTRLQSAWIKEQTQIINDNFDNYVNEVINTLFERKGTKHDYKTTLGNRKKEVIDRLIDENTEFANIVETIKNEKGIDAISTKGKNKTLDYFKLSKELMTRGIPDGLVDMKDLAVIADNGLGRSGDIGKHLKILKDALFKRIKGLVTNAINQINTADIPSDKEIEEQIDVMKGATELAKQAALQEVKNKTDKELLAEEHLQAKDTHEKEAKRYDERYEADKKDKDRIMKEHGVTQDMLNAAREGTLLHQEVAEEERKTTDAIEESNSAAASRTSASSQPSGGYYYGGYGYGGFVDVSGLAKEGTLRGIYELLNGGAPKGGWDDSISESDKTIGNADVLSDNNVIGKYQSLAESAAVLMKNAKNMPHEAISLLGNKNIWSQASSGERGFITMDDVYGAIKKEKHVLKASLHNHPNGIGMMSKDDVRNFLKLAYDENIPEKQRIKIHGAYSDTELSSLNFNGIVKGLAEKIVETTFNEFYEEVTKAGLKYNDKEDTYYRGDVALDPKKTEDLQIINNLEKYFYERLYKNFENFGFDEAFQFVNADSIDDWSKTATESAKDILARAEQRVIDRAISEAVSTSDDDTHVDTSTVNDTTTKVANTIVENAGETAVEAATTVSPEVSAPELQTAADKVAEEIVDGAGDAVQKASVTEQPSTQNTDISKDLSAVYDKIFENIDFAGVPKDLLNKIKQDVIKQTKNRVGNEGHFNNRLQLTDDDRLEAVSADLYKIPEQRKKIIGDLMDTLELYFILANKVYPYQVNEGNIEKYIDSILPDAAQKVAENVVNTGAQAAFEASEEIKPKGKKSNSKKKNSDTKPAENKPETPTSSVQEQVNAESKITQNKEEQNNLAREAEQLEDKLTTEVQERAAAEQKAADAKTESEENAASINNDNSYVTQSSSVNNNPPDNGEYNEGGLLGLLGRIAREETLSKIATLLANGVKTKSDDDKKSDDKGKKPDDSKEKSKNRDLTVVDARQEAQNYIQTYYPDFTSVSALKPVSGGYSVDVVRNRAVDTEAVKKAEAEVNRLIEEGKQGTAEYIVAQGKLNSLKLEQEKITLRISAVEDQIIVTAKTGYQNLAVGTKAAAKELQNVDAMLSRLTDTKAISVDAKGNAISGSATISSYLDSVKTLMEYQDQLTPEQLLDPATEQRLNDLALAVQTYRKEVTTLLNAMDQYNGGKTFGEMFNGDALSMASTDIKQSMVDMLSQSDKTVTKFGDLEKVTSKYGEVVAYKLAYTLQTGKREVQEMTAVLNPLTREIKIQEGAVKEVATGWDKFISGFKGKLVSIAQYLMSMASINDVFRYMREGVQYVREIDSALTELRKVTDETDASYARFLQDMAKTGSVIGATVTDLTSSAADWARLGSIIKSAPLYSNI